MGAFVASRSRFLSGARNEPQANDAARGPLRISRDAPQHVLEPILHEAALSFGADIRFGHEVVAMRQDAEHATARVRRRHDASEFEGALAKMIALLDRVEGSVMPGCWLSGDSFGLADAAPLSYVLRLDHLAMGPLLSAGVRPALADWYERVRARRSYETAVASWAPAPAVEILRMSGQAAWPQVWALAK